MNNIPRPNRKTASLRLKLLLLPLWFLAGLVVLKLANLYTGRQVSEKVVFPGFSEQAMGSYRVLLKATVDIEVATVAARLKSLKTREEKIAAIVEETDLSRFFDDGSGYFLPTIWRGCGSMCRSTRAATGRISCI